MKIIEAVNTMISNSDKITEVYKNDKELFFLFNKKYKWSIIKRDENFLLFLYPKDDFTIEQLSSRDDLDFSNYNNFITYTSEEIKTREATESFAELYQIINSKVLGADQILDDIINMD